MQTTIYRYNGRELKKHIKFSHYQKELYYDVKDRLYFIECTAKKGVHIADVGYSSNDSKYSHMVGVDVPVKKEYEDFMELYSDSGSSSDVKISVYNMVSNVAKYRDLPYKRVFEGELDQEKYKTADILNEIKDYFGISLSEQKLKKALNNNDRWEYQYIKGSIRRNTGTMFSTRDICKVKKAEKLANGVTRLIVDVERSGSGGAGFSDSRGRLTIVYKNINFYIKEAKESKYGYNLVERSKLGKGNQVWEK